MADPLSVTASVVAIITVALKSVQSLSETVSRFKGRDKTLQRLQNELEDVAKILDSLAQVSHVEVPISSLLGGPIDRCGKVCQEFKQSMVSFAGKPKASVLDWAKLEFMRGDINEFIETLSGYKSTIAVGLGTINIRAATVSQQALEDYNEMIQSTIYDLNLHMQRIDEKLELYSGSNLSTSIVDLDDEKKVTEKCLQVCQEASQFLESVNQKSNVLQNVRDDTEGIFEAQLLTQKALSESQDNFGNIMNQLRGRLERLISENDPANNDERARLLDDINTSKQCLEVCKLASEASKHKVYKVGEAVAEGDCDQVVVTTLADLFDVGKVISKGRSVQLVGSMSEDGLRDLTTKRYGSRYAAFPTYSEHSKNTPSTVQKKKGVALPFSQTDETYQYQSRDGYSKSTPNEVRKRKSGDDQQ